MTGPVAGHPDWQDPTSWRSGTLHFNTEQLVAGETRTLGAWNITHYASLRLSLTLTAGGAQFEVHTSTDPAFVLYETHKTWELASPHTMTVALPSLASYVRLRIIAPATNGVTVLVSAQMTNAVTENVRYSGSALHIVEFNTVIGPGAMNVVTTERVTPGPAFIMLDMATGPPTLLARFRRIRSDGTAVNRIAQWVNIAGVTQQIIHLPEVPWDFAITNTGGVNQQYSLSITTGVGTL
jgi:hypothetical protein